MISQQSIRGLQAAQGKFFKNPFPVSLLVIPSILVIQPRVPGKYPPRPLPVPRAEALLLPRSGGARLPVSFRSFRVRHQFWWVVMCESVVRGDREW